MRTFEVVDDPGRAAGTPDSPSSADAPNSGGNNPPALTLADWLAREIPSADFLLGEILSTSSRMMLIGATGLGKTMLALAIAFSVALGRELMHWGPGRKGRVLYIDGEMSRRTLKKRLREAMQRAEIQDADETWLVILSREDFEGMPPLNTPKGQKWIDRFISEHGPFDLVIFDNVQALTEGGQKEEDTWRPLLSWVRSLTRQSIGQIWLHHTGIDESRGYGDKAREWQMDTVAILKRVKDAGADLAFSIEFTKARERTPENRADFEPITMRLVADKWTHGAGVAHKDSKLNDRYRNAYTALTSLVALRGEKLPPSWQLPPELCAVTLDALKAEWKARDVIKADDKNDRVTFGRISDALVSKGYAAKREGRIWPISK